MILRSKIISLRSKIRKLVGLLSKYTPKNVVHFFYLKKYHYIYGTHQACSVVLFLYYCYCISALLQTPTINTDDSSALSYFATVIFMFSYQH